MFESNDIPDLRSTDQVTDQTRPQKVYHDRLGDLSAHKAFIMRKRDSGSWSFTEKFPLYIHLSVTGRCQAQCQGCINIAFNNSAAGSGKRIRAPFADTDPVRDARCIINLIKEHSCETATVCLYGGEPLLAPHKMQSLMQYINNADLACNVRYMLYTNGGLLQESIQSYPEMIRAIWLYSVSIDGTREQHERIRRGTSLARIHAGLAALKELRQGQVLMWSTLREDQSLLDCFMEFICLYDRGLVDQFFWHWVESDAPFVSLSRYAALYEKDLQHIMKEYVAKLQKGILLPITHINELVLYLLSGKKRKSTACGVELARNYDIVGGKIHSCADLPEQYAIGTVTAEGMPAIKPQDLSWLTHYKKGLGCSICGVQNYCGGRCPVQAVTGSKERLRQYCQLMRLHVGIVNDYLDDIICALQSHAITPQDIYDLSAYFVQFTDGTP